MKARAIIVDLDGTLLDTRRRHFHTYREAVLRLGGQPAELATFWASKRRAAPWPDLLTQAFGGPVGPEIERRFLEDFARSIEDPGALKLDRLQPGVGAALDRLQRAGVEAVLRRQLADLGLDGRLTQVIATGGASKHGVIDADLRARADAWIGDTEEDCASARALRVPILLVANGIRTRGRLAQLQPDQLTAGFGGAVRHYLAARR